MSTPINSAQEPTQGSIPKICYWDKIPYELREQIFASIDGFTEPEHYPSPIGSSKYFRRAPIGPSPMPALVVALRMLPMSYSHVMEWFTKANYHIIHYANDEEGQDLSDMTRCELEAIRSINLIIVMDNPFEMGAKEPCSCAFTGTDRRKIHLPRRLKQNLSLAVNIGSVYLDFRHFDEHDLMHWLTEFPFCLEGFKSLTRLTINVPESVWELDHHQYSRIVEGMMTHVSQRVGVRGEVAHKARQKWAGPSRIYQDENVKWIWEAFPGQLMDWSQQLGRVWKFPRARRHEWTLEEEERIWMITCRLRFWNWEVDYELLEQWRRL